MPTCPNCGNDVEEGKKFCTSCGTQLVAPEAASTESTYGKLERFYTSRGLTRYQIQVQHSGLGQYKTIQGDNPHIVEQKARAQMRRWNENWQRKQEAERARQEKQQKAQAVAEKKALAEDRTREAQEALAVLEQILAHTLDIDDTVDWEALKDDSAFSAPRPEEPALPRIPTEPQRTDEKYQPDIGFLDRVISSRKTKKEQAAEDQFGRDHREWQEEQGRILAAHSTRMQEYQTALVSWEEERDSFMQRQAESNAAIDAQKADYLAGGDPQAILDYCELVLSNSEYPDYFPKSFDLDYTPENRVLIVDYELPSLDQLPTVRDVQYVQSRDEFTERTISQAQLNRTYNSVLHQITLRTIHELYEADQVDALSSTVFNGYVRSIDPATGREINPCVLSVQAGKEEFEQVNLALVDPAACFKSLKGIGSARLQSMTPIAPILKIDREDARFIESYRVADGLDEGVNLAAMDWEDFEHFIRELFEKEFASTGGEVKVTRASRDGGVDAVAFDPDPIRGGKIVIQAKRYTGTVGVSAVRDLYGTVVNEGATKGIIVTTSHYGPDAYEFARGKPLTLLDGNNLLNLLERHGHRAKIDIQEARRMLRGE